MSHVQNDTRKIVKSKDITKGIARMLVLDLRSFDTVEGVGFNELFKLVPNPFPNLNSFANPDKSENIEIFGYPSRSRKNFVFPTRFDISRSLTPLLVILIKNWILYLYLFIFVYILLCTHRAWSSFTSRY